MKKKTSPQARSGRGRISSSARGPAVARRAAARGAAVTRGATVPRPPVRGRQRFVRLASAYLLPTVILISLVVVVGLMVLVGTNSGFVPLPATIAQLWLVANLAPVSGSSAILGVVPALPAVGVVWLVARQVRRAIHDRASIVDVMILAIAIPLVPMIITAISAGMLWDASSVLPVRVPPLGRACAMTALVHTTGLVIGLGRRLWRALLSAAGIPVYLVSGALVAAQWARWMARVATVVFMVSLALHHDQISEIASQFHGVGADVGLAVLSLLYLPNAIVATAAVVLGSGVQFGAATVSLFDVTLVPLPPLPLLAAVPAAAPAWFEVFIAVPAVAAGIATYKHLSATKGELWGLYPAGVFAAAITLVATVATRGEMGVYGIAGPMLWLTPCLAFIWVTAVTLVVAAVSLSVARSRVRAQQAAVDTAAAHFDDSLVDGGELTPTHNTPAGGDDEGAAKQDSNREEDDTDAPDDLCSPDTIPGDTESQDTVDSGVDDPALEDSGLSESDLDQGDGDRSDTGGLVDMGPSLQGAEQNCALEEQHAPCGVQGDGNVTAEDTTAPGVDDGCVPSQDGDVADADAAAWRSGGCDPTRRDGMRDDVPDASGVCSHVAPQEQGGAATGAVLDASSGHVPAAQHRRRHVSGITPPGAGADMPAEDQQDAVLRRQFTAVGHGDEDDRTDVIPVVDVDTGSGDEDGDDPTGHPHARENRHDD